MGRKKNLVNIGSVVSKKNGFRSIKTMETSITNNFKLANSKSNNLIFHSDGLGMLSYFKLTWIQLLSSFQNQIAEYNYLYKQINIYYWTLL